MSHENRVFIVPWTLSEKHDCSTICLLGFTPRTFGVVKTRRALERERGDRGRALAALSQRLLPQRPSRKDVSVALGQGVSPGGDEVIIQKGIIGSKLAPISA